MSSTIVADEITPVAGSPAPPDEQFNSPYHSSTEYRDDLARAAGILQAQSNYNIFSEPRGIGMYPIGNARGSVTPEVRRQLPRGSR